MSTHCLRFTQLVNVSVLCNMSVSLLIFLSVHLSPNAMHWGSDGSPRCGAMLQPVPPLLPLLGCYNYYFY